MIATQCTTSHLKICRKYQSYVERNNYQDYFQENYIIIPSTFAVTLKNCNTFQMKKYNERNYKTKSIFNEKM